MEDNTPGMTDVVLDCLEEPFTWCFTCRFSSTLSDFFTLPPGTGGNAMPATIGNNNACTTEKLDLSSLGSSIS
jgi:hypothetical protein